MWCGEVIKIGNFQNQTRSHSFVHAVTPILCVCGFKLSSTCRDAVAFSANQLNQNATGIRFLFCFELLKKTLLKWKFPGISSWRWNTKFKLCLFIDWEQIITAPFCFSSLLPFPPTSFSSSSSSSSSELKNSFLE